MSDNTFCQYCGSHIKPGDAFCNNCGASLDSVDTKPAPSTPASTPTNTPGYKPPAPSESFQPVQKPQGYTPPQQTQYGSQPSATYTPPLQNKDADRALVFGVLGLFCLPGIFSLLAIIFGFMGLQKDYGRSKAIWGIVLGFIVIGIAIIGIVLRFIVWY